MKKGGEREQRRGVVLIFCAWKSPCRFSDMEGFVKCAINLLWIWSLCFCGVVLQTGKVFLVFPPLCDSVFSVLFAGLGFFFLFFSLVVCECACMHVCVSQ